MAFIWIGGTIAEAPTDSNQWIYGQPVAGITFADNASYFLLIMYHATTIWGV